MKSLTRGMFITVEGTEGGGKSTNVRFMCDWLEQQGYEFIHTREPGGTELAEAIRELLLQPHNEAVVDTTELLMVFAARCQHLNNVIKPALAAGKIVVCDRFTDATYAYQGAGRGIEKEHIALLENLVQGALRPDLTLLLDISVAEGMARTRKRGAPDRIEQEKHCFFERIRHCYLERAEQYPQQYTVIDAARTLPEVQAQIVTVLEQRLDIRRG